MTDKSRLSQVLVNLLGNAFKFTFNGGITVRVRPDDSDSTKVWFYIADTGIGIKKQDQSRLFQMYGKLEQEDKKVNTHGIGLGLTMSNMLAMLLNPKDSQSIQVESELGKGTCFSFAINSQVEAKGSNEISPEDFSSNILHEDRDATVLKKMSIYTKLDVNCESKSPLVSSDQQGTEKAVCSTIALVSNENIALRPIKLGSIGLDISPLPNQTFSSSAQKYKGTSEDRAQDITKPWCLVVDDNPFNLMVACHIMEERNYLVKTGLNGQEAIQRAKDHKAKGHSFSVILMDCQMPVMDGYEASKILREMMKNGECDECPIIALTANNRDEEHEKRCEEVGMSGHISKPLQTDELEEVLKEVCVAKRVK